MRVKQTWIFLGLLASCLGGLMGLIQPLWSGEDPGVSLPPPTIAPEKQAEMKAVRLTEIQEGEKRWILTAVGADYLKDQDTIQLRKVSVEIIGKDDDTITITGNIGFINPKSRELTLQGDVRAESRSYEFSSDLVRYDPKARVLSAPGEVKVQGPRIYVEGRGLSIDLQHKKLDVAEHIVTRMQFSGNIWKFKP